MPNMHLYHGGERCLSRGPERLRDQSGTSRATLATLGVIRALAGVTADVLQSKRRRPTVVRYHQAVLILGQAWLASFLVGHASGITERTSEGNPAAEKENYKILGTVAASRPIDFQTSNMFEAPLFDLQVISSNDVGIHHPELGSSTSCSPNSEHFRPPRQRKENRVPGRKGRAEFRPPCNYRSFMERSKDWPSKALPSENVVQKCGAAGAYWVKKKQRSWQKDPTKIDIASRLQTGIHGGFGDPG